MWSRRNTIFPPTGSPHTGNISIPTSLWRGRPNRRPAAAANLRFTFVAMDCAFHLFQNPQAFSA